MAMWRNQSSSVLGISKHILAPVGICKSLGTEKPQLHFALTSPALCWELTSPAVPTLGSSVLQKGGSQATAGVYFDLCLLKPETVHV